MKTPAIDPKLMTRDLTRAWGVVARHLPVPIFDDKSYDRAVKAMNELVDQCTLSKILRGNRAISKTLAKALAARFKVSVETFV